MIRFAAALLVSIGLTACSSTPPDPSTLQRFQRTAPELQKATLAARAVAVTARAAADAVSRGDVNRARRGAQRLARDAAALRSSAGRALRVLAPILRAAPSRLVAAYFRALSRALSAQSREGAVVGQEAALLYADPLLMRGADVARQGTLDRAARREAQASVRMASIAARIRKTHPGAFHYTPVIRG
ncbi:MAG TPA: hypothetical protein VKX16_00245 [Chloroflexota bacterium]|nr:hypothetical protein [Chloroflexota bacterium]